MMSPAMPKIHQMPHHQRNRPTVHQPVAVGKVESLKKNARCEYGPAAPQHPLEGLMIGVSNGIPNGYETKYKKDVVKRGPQRAAMGVTVLIITVSMLH